MSYAIDDATIRVYLSMDGDLVIEVHQVLVPPCR
jgi:hypothetical protein